MIIVNGEEINNIAELAREHGINPVTVRSRIRYGWSLEKALTTSARGVTRDYKIESRPLEESIGKWFGKPIEGLPGTLYCRNITEKKGPHKCALVLCFCGDADCREFFSTRISYLKDIKSCGANQGKIKRGEAAFNSIYRVYKRDNIKKSGRWHLPFEISKRLFRKLIQQNCVYCGREPSSVRGSTEFNRYNGTFLYNGLDRVDNSKGYTIDNVVSCCSKCNRAKGTMTVDEFKEWIFKVSTHLAYNI